MNVVIKTMRILLVLAAGSYSQILIANSIEYGAILTYESLEGVSAVPSGQFDSDYKTQADVFLRFDQESKAINTHLDLNYTDADYKNSDDFDTAYETVEAEFQWHVVPSILDINATYQVLQTTKDQTVSSLALGNVQSTKISKLGPVISTELANNVFSLSAEKEHVEYSDIEDESDSDSVSAVLARNINRELSVSISRTAKDTVRTGTVPDNEYMLVNDSLELNYRNKKNALKIVSGRTYFEDIAGMIDNKLSEISYTRNFTTKTFLRLVSTEGFNTRSASLDLGFGVVGDVFYEDRKELSFTWTEQLCSVTVYFNEREAVSVDTDSVELTEKVELSVSRRLNNNGNLSLSLSKQNNESLNSVSNFSDASSIYTLNYSKILNKNTNISLYYNANETDSAQSLRNYKDKRIGIAISFTR